MFHIILMTFISVSLENKYHLLSPEAGLEENVPTLVYYLQDGTCTIESSDTIEIEPDDHVLEVFFDENELTTQYDQNGETPGSENQDTSTKTRQHEKNTPVSDADDLKCHICCITFHTAKQIASHDAIVHTKAQEYSCNLCDIVFKRKCLLDSHLKFDHEGKSPKLKNGGKTLKCSKGASHQELQFQCGVCDKMFKTKKGLDYHMLIHYSNNLFECTVCGKGFVRSHELKMHSVSHIKDRLYSCMDCSKTFKTQQHLTLHSIKHMYESL